VKNFQLPGHLPLHFLVAYVTFEPPGEALQRSLMRSRKWSRRWPGNEARSVFPWVITATWYCNWG